MGKQKLAMNAAQMEKALEKMAYDIAASRGDGEMVLIGIRARGDHLAKRIARFMEKKGAAGGQSQLPIGALDITLYRDDIELSRPEIRTTEIPGGSIEGKTVALVDDVLFTGRTVRAALDALMDYGRPKKIQLAALVDRGHRELPIRADFVGMTLETSREDDVVVTLAEDGKEDSVFVA